VGVKLIELVQYSFTYSTLIMAATCLHYRKGNGGRVDRGCQPGEHRRSLHMAHYRSRFQILCRSAVCHSTERSADTERGKLSMSALFGHVKD